MTEKLPLPHAAGESGGVPDFVVMPSGQNFTTVDLLAELSLANNGYLFAPLGCMLNLAERNKAMFSVTGGIISKQKFVVPQYAGAPEKQRQLVVDGPDYEAMIMARQESSGCYD